MSWRRRAESNRPSQRRGGALLTSPRLLDSPAGEVQNPRVPLDASSSGAGAGVLFAFLVFAGLYFLPTIVALSRHHQEGMVLILNLFLGWTGIGWVISLAIAFGSESKPVIVQQSVGAAAVPQFSSDGRWWWDGQRWQPVPNQTPPPTEPQAPTAS